jgi:hypothetical protein
VLRRGNAGGQHLTTRSRRSVRPLRPERSLTTLSVYCPCCASVSASVQMFLHENADTSDLLYVGFNGNPCRVVLDGVATLQAGIRRGCRASSARDKFIAGPLDVVQTWLFWTTSASTSSSLFARPPSRRYLSAIITKSVRSSRLPLGNPEASSITNSDQSRAGACTTPSLSIGCAAGVSAYVRYSIQAPPRLRARTTRPF